MRRELGAPPPSEGECGAAPRPYVHNARSDPARTFHPPEADPVNRPAHYTAGGIECIDAIRSALTPEEFRGYCKGAALKYVWRERLKGGAESLAKAEWYLKEAAK